MAMLRLLLKFRWKVVVPFALMAGSHLVHSVTPMEPTSITALDSQQSLDWIKTVGSTPFQSEHAIDIKDFCDGHSNTDSTGCAQQWLQAAQEQGKHLYASAGIYTLSDSLNIFNNMHLRCESPKTIFRKRGDRGSPHFTSVRYGQPIVPVRNVLIENCGFDMNGDQSNFASAIRLSQAQHITLRDNRIFDSTGTRSDARDRQRQYVLILSAVDILIENNHLSEGGRIKLGQPGKRLVIRNNVLDFVNDNGITVVGVHTSPWPDGSNVSEDILITGNRIIDPTVTGIFFGADGEPNGINVIIRRVTIANNIISGPLSACIKGTLPDHASEILIAHNQCHHKIPSFGWSDNQFNSGIRLDRADNTTGEAKSITVIGNEIHAKSPDILDLGALFVGGRVQVCQMDNIIRNSALAARFTKNSRVYFSGNDWGGGKIKVDSATRLEDSSNCFFPPFLIDLDS